MSQPAIPICQGTTRNGTPCGSPALRGKPYCYFHAPGRPALHRARSTRKPLPLPPLDNHDAIQTALGHIITGLAADRMDPKSATAALYAIQCALQSLKQRAITGRARKPLTTIGHAEKLLTTIGHPG